MPSLRTIFRRDTSDGDSSKSSGSSTNSPKFAWSPKSFKSPISPTTPKSPKSIDLCKTERNPDGLNQCAGCGKVELMIRRNQEHQKNGTTKLPATVLHNSFAELDQCALKCEICRVFRQSLILGEVLGDRVKELQNTPGEVLVRWETSTDVDGASRVVLNVELNGQPERSGVIDCNKRNEVGHLALYVDSLNPNVITQAKGWLETCRDTHIGQCDNLKWSSENPKLLIDILSPDSVQLCENQKGDYVALSYCWGDWKTLSEAEKDEVERGKTVLANLEQRRRPFAMDTLPTTVRDALQIIYAMGLRLAWIDTLCIIQDAPDGVATMHKVYSNALFTLNACATTRATAKLLDQRDAWSLQTEPCRLGGQWLTTPDMSLNELRLKSPLAGRAWTLQEERLSPRMLYVSSSRMHWSCASSQEMEMKPVYGRKAVPLHRPIYAPLDRNTQMPLAQKFLLACYSGTSDLHVYWADIVKSYAMRSMTNISDRFTALSGLAAKYLSASRNDEYLAGIWANNLAEGLAWRVYRAIDVQEAASGPMTNSTPWPSWSWAVVPLQTAIDTNVKSERSSYFRRIVDEEDETFVSHEHADDAIQKGEQVKEIRVTGRVRKLWEPSSSRVEWSSVSKTVHGEEKFTFAANPDQNMHAIHPESGRILIYEDRKKEVCGQLDFQQDVRRVQSEPVELWALELARSNVLLLEACGEGIWRRVGLAWNVREDYLAPAQSQNLVIR